VTIYDFFDKHEFLFLVSILLSSSCFVYVLKCIVILFRGYQPLNSKQEETIDQSIDGTM
jgi:hypothetical protein